MYWDEIWEATDQKRITAYVKKCDLTPDAVIRYLHKRGAVSVCDAGCGCGLFSLKLAANGFSVSGFDISAKAAGIASDLLKKKGYYGEFRAATVTETGYLDHAFDAVVSMDVLDHMPLQEAKKAVQELCRITRPGGCVIASVDGPDEEYESEPHTVNEDGDYLYTDGKWKGRVHHPYTPEELGEMTGKPYVMLEDPDDKKGQYTLVIRNWES